MNYISSTVSDMQVSKKEGEAKISGIGTLGWQDKEPKMKSREKASELLSTIHSHICKPMQMAALNCEQYFITFTDEKSGHVGTSLLCKKVEALVTFEAYRARAQNMTSKGIRSLRSEGGGEYLSGRLKKYLAESGIQHIVSPRYSAAQNGLAERMN